MNSDAEKAKRDVLAALHDLDRNSRQLRDLGVPVIERNWNEADAPDDMAPADGDGVFSTFCIGGRGMLVSKEARISAKAWRKFIGKYPKAISYLHIAGYDGDIREIWEIDEARDYVRRWARFAGLESMDDALRLLKEPGTVGLLAKCGAFKGVDPADVPVLSDTSTKH